MVVAERFRGRQQGQPPPPGRSKPSYGDPGKGFVVKIVEGMGDAGRGASVSGERKPAIRQIAHPGVVRLGARKDDPIGRTRLDDVSDGRHRIGATRIGRHDQMIGRRGEMAGDARNDVGDETHQLLVRVEHQADDVRLARPQANAGTIWPIADLARDELHPPACFLADLGRILERARHGGDAKPGHEGDRLQRRLAIARRRSAVSSRLLFHVP